MNDKSRMILKILAGGYILYIGISLLVGVLQTEPNEKILMIFVSIFFVAVGSTVLYTSGRVLFKEYGIDIEFWKHKKEHITGEEESEDDLEAFGEAEADFRRESHVELQNLSEDDGESVDQQEDTLADGAMHEENCVQNDGQEESDESVEDVEEAEEDVKQEDTELEEQPEEEQAVEERNSEEETAAEEEEASFKEETDESSDTGEEQHRIEEELTESDLPEEKKEENPSERLFRRRQASISPMPQRRS